MSFRLKTILGIALIEGCLLLLLVWSSISYLRDASQNETAIRAETTSRLFVDLVRDAVLSSDLARLESLAQQALEAPDMAYVRIMDSERVLVEAGASPAPGSNHRDREPNDHIFDVGTDITIEGSVYGRVELGMRTDRAAAFIDDARQYLSSLAAIEMILVALFSYALGVYLTRGLDRLTHAAMAISQGEPHQPVAFAGNDELAVTGQAFNTMAERLQESRQAMQYQIQESRTLAQNLAEKEQRLSTILNAAFNGIISLDRQGLIESINHAGAVLFGYQPQELVGRHASLLMPDAFQVPPAASHSIDTTGRHRDGSVVAIEISLSDMLLSEKRMQVCLVRDVSERLRMERESRRHAAISAALVEANMDAVVIIDLDDNIIEFSTMAERLFGHRREQAIGRNMAELLIPPNMRAPHHHGMRQYQQTGQGPILGKHIEVEAMRADGGVFPAELTVQPIKLDGTVLFAGFMRDISARKAAEQELRDARLCAEAASDAKSRFLAHMSHEIRSPLNAVLGSVGLLLDDQLSREQRLYAQTAEASGKALLGLINNILDFSRIEAGQIQLDNQHFRLDELLSDIAAHIALKARKKHIQTTLVAAPELPRQLIGDASRLRQILINLLDNALKFTEQGAVTLLITPLQIQADSVRLRLVVQDSGIGIPLEEQTTLFDEFQQVDSSDSTLHGGSGLGLSISRGLCRAMGGDLTLNSEPGAGASFIATLPFAHAGHDVAHPGSPPREPRLHLMCHGLHPLTRAAIRLASGEQIDTIDNLNAELGLDLPEKPGHRVLLVNGDRPRTELQALAASARSLNIDDVILLCSDETDSSVTACQQGNLNRLMMPLLARPLLRMLARSDSTESAPAPSLTDDEHALLGSRPGRGHILLAEDSPANQLVARAMLTRAGYRVEIAENGRQAVQAYSQGHHDLILMDLRMPVMDGLQATAAIRAQEQERHIPILAMTANVSKEDVDRCLAAGMDDFIPKPIESKQLMAALQRHLRLRAERPVVSPVPSSGTEWETATLLDHQVIDALSDAISPAQMPETITLFMDETRHRLERIRQALDSQSLEVATLEAHTIKGCAGTFGATRLHYWAREMEAACRRADQKQITALTVQMTTLYQQTVQYYRNKITALTGDQDETDTNERGTGACRPDPAG